MLFAHFAVMKVFVDFVYQFIWNLMPLVVFVRLIFTDNPKNYKEF